MRFVALQLPNELPSWCSCQKGLGEEYICKIDWNKELLETFKGDFNPTIDIQGLLECLGFGYVSWLSTNLKVKDDCYLSDLNLIFPQGIPFTNVLPSVFVNGKYCFLINLLILDDKQKRWVKYAYEANKVPIVFNALLQVKNIAIVPADLVDEIITA
jgi:hypothetical protein